MNVYGFTTTLTAPDSITGTGALDFIGFTSSTPITSITIDWPGYPNFGALDNVSYGTAVTPEPSTFVFLGTGLLGLAGAAHRKLGLTGLIWVRYGCLEPLERFQSQQHLVARMAIGT
jgi:hypothetical protein